MKALRINGWSEYYETAESKRTRALSWVATPNGHDSKSFRRLAKRPDFLAVFGAWNIILQQASKCPTRGVLVNARGEPYTASDFADLTGGTEAEYSTAIALLTEVKWLAVFTISDEEKEPELPAELLGTPSKTLGTPTDSLPTETETQQYKTDNQLPAPRAAAPADVPLDSGEHCGPVFPVRDGDAWRMTKGLRKTLADAYPTADLDGEFAKAAAWCVTAVKRKTARGMPRFLNGWLSRNHQRAAADAKPSGPTVLPLTQEQIDFGLQVEAEARRGG